MIRNPFITSGYVSADYFCDRQQESEQLVREVMNGNNLALVSTRRMGKTGLIRHCFQFPEIKQGYYTFFIDIYDSRSLRDLVFALSKEILEVLKPVGKKALHGFWECVKSLQASISFDVNGMPSLNLGLGDIQAPATTLDEIFRYLEQADKPCLIAIDEFQQITGYAEKNVEATLRTYVQHCNNARFIFAGSQRHVMGNMFLTPSRPFYQSVSMMHLERIPLEEYVRFACMHFKRAGKEMEESAVTTVYQQFEGITWYIQKVLNTLYDMTPEHGVCKVEMVSEAIRQIIDSFRYTYSEILFRLPEKQKELLIAITKEGRAKALTSGTFIEKFILLLQKYPKALKAGFSICIDDLPDHYKLKEKVIEWESVFWKEEIEPNIFKALIDTTFAVYKPYFIGEPIDPDCFCIRTGHPYSVRHLPWYMNSAKPTEEELYYLGHIKTLTHWSKQNQTNTNSAKKE